ncbi:unnamed protein product [Oikopleura dioica]|uniref:Uncharacterized protein n=1 Tax=Oikopleura dioica TaxID=34765 RepID=E4YUF5_OIKDI|nr:unnamed protein product [Oikopleura dioica]
MNRLLSKSHSLITTSERTAKAVAKSRLVLKERNPRKGTKTFGAMIEEGEPVKMGQLIWNQAQNQNGPWSCLPGANAEPIFEMGWNEFTNKKGIYALCDGTVRYTKEMFIPAKNTRLAGEITKMPAGSFIYKLHCHVVPKPINNNFKLVDLS